MEEHLIDREGVEQLPGGGRYYTSLGLELLPAGPDAHPTLSASEAAANFHGVGVRPGSQPGNVELVLATDGLWRTSDYPDAPTYVRRLSWAFTYDDTEPLDRGGPYRPEERVAEWRAWRKAHPLYCQDFGLVDAHTGAVLRIVQVCRHRSTDDPKTSSKG